MGNVSTSYGVNGITTPPNIDGDTFGLRNPITYNNNFKFNKTIATKKKKSKICIDGGRAEVG